MKKIFRIFFVFCFSLPSSSFFSPVLHAEDVNISTYYPSPYGSYRRLSIEEDGAVEATQYGSLQIVRGFAGHLGSHIAFIRETTSWMGLGYQQSSSTFGFGPGVNNATAFDPTYLSIDSAGDVGIGTNNPGQKLTVEGTIGILEGGASPSRHTIFQGGDQTADITYTLPTSQGAANTVLTNSDGAGTLSWAVQAAGGTPSTITVYSTAGSFNWTAPAGVTRIHVQVWGGGGGGGGATGCTGYGNGGGGGGYAESILSVTPGISYPVRVGSGGATVANAAAFSGASSSFGPTASPTLATTVSATGGQGGLRDCEAESNTALGGTGFGQIAMSGGSGVSGRFPSRGGDSPLGGIGGVAGQNLANSTGNGEAGKAPGGGGGCGGSTGVYGLGGNGASGRVVIRY